MVGTNATMIAIRLVRSKLRKRDDNHHSNVHTQDVVLQTTTTTPGGVPTATTLSTITTISGQTCPEQLPASGNGNGVYPPQFLWQYPAQYSLYSNDQRGMTSCGWVGSIAVPVPSTCSDPESSTIRLYTPYLRNDQDSVVVSGRTCEDAGDASLKGNLHKKSTQYLPNFGIN